MKFLRLLFVVFFLLLPAGAFAGEPAAPAVVSSKPISPVLPAEFAGWQVKGTVARSDDPAAADAVNAAVLKEYGFQSLEKAAYTRDDGRNLAIKAAVFSDASGAYGAFTFYCSAEMGAGTIGGGAAYLPKKGLETNTTKYILGPVALARVGSPLPGSLVDFTAGAEVVIGRYTATAGDATLMLIEYPTPQIAAERQRQIDASHQVAQPQPGVAAMVDVGPFYDARTGPILVIAAGPISKSEARSLMSSISYEADVTWNENTYLSKKDNMANFLFNAIVLCGIVVGLSLVAGIAFGGVRVVVKRFFPDSVFDRREAMEFISLHLDDHREAAPRER